MPMIEIDPRFRGFSEIALGGYVGGILAKGRSDSEAVLRRPVKLGRPYEMSVNSEGTTSLQEGSDVLAFARDSSIDLIAPEPVGLEDSKAAAKDYVGFRKHLVPSCFNCGPSRTDGLGIFPGIISGRDVVAAPWTPGESLGNSAGMVESEFIWSALDCPTIWALVLQGRPDSKEMAVTAKLGVRLISPVHVGETYVVMGWRVSENERNKVSGGAVYSADGKLHAVAKHTLAMTSWGVPMGLNSWR